MKLAVFVNQFPSKVSTFFSRDIRALIDNDIDIDIFPVYPLKQSLWAYVPEILSPQIFPRSRVYHSTPFSFFSLRGLLINCKRRKLFGELTDILSEAREYGIEQFVKTLYVLPLAYQWAAKFEHTYDHLFAYWGNYTGTYAYVAHRLMNRQLPFSIFLHAGTDLYRNQVYLRQKLLHSDNIITCSEFNRKYIKNLFPSESELLLSKLYVYHHGLDIEKFDFKLDNKSANNIIGVGNLTERKGYRYLLYAAAILAEREIEFDVDLFGDGEEQEFLQTLAMNLGISKRVKFHGWVEFRQAYAAIKKATILVHPSSGLGDGVPNVIKEAIALGTPVIASDVAGVSEIITNGESGILVPPRNSEKLACAIKTMLGNAALRRDYAKTARAFFEKKFDLWKNGQELAHLLSETIRE